MRALIRREPDATVSMFEVKQDRVTGCCGRRDVQRLPADMPPGNRSWVARMAFLISFVSLIAGCITGQAAERVGADLLLRKNVAQPTKRVPQEIPRIDGVADKNSCYNQFQVIGHRKRRSRPDRRFVGQKFSDCTWMQGEGKGWLCFEFDALQAEGASYSKRMPS